MPELPEVETFRRGLYPHVVGRTIVDLRITYPKIIRYPETEIFEMKMKGQKIEDLSRRGKYLIFNLKSDFCLIVHFRMSAHFEVAAAGSPQDKHTHVVFVLDDGNELRFVEPRKFGTMHLLQETEYSKGGGFVCQGPEPMSEEFTESYLRDKLSASKSRVKSLLLDQTIISGLGNIYADEVLFAAGVHPERIANTLTADEVAKLFPAINDIICNAIECHGSSVRTYTDVNGEKGSFQDMHHVYGREGKVCHRCGGEIHRIRVGGRSAHYCSCCQK